MKFTDLNPKREIGAHSLLVELGEFRLLVDGGMSPKDLGLAALPDYTRIPPNSIDLILVTHCHLDHIGSLPCIHRDQPAARVLMTPASAEILPVMLHNSHTVMLRQRDELEVAEYPLFSRSEVDAIADDLFPMDYGKTREFIKGNDRLRITFFPAGHVMGAASVLIEHRGKKHFFTGDILFRRQHTLEGAQIPAMRVDTLVMETTRGTAEHAPGFTYEGELGELFGAVGATLRRGGSCLLPVFALGRMQEMVTLVMEARRQRILPKNFPIYCSGLGLAVVDVFDRIFRSRRRYGLDFHAPDPITIAAMRQDLSLPLAPKGEPTFRRQILTALGVRPLPFSRLSPGRDFREPSLFITSSGMLVENTPAYQVASCLLPHARNLVAFTGFCDDDTPGGDLLARDRGDSFAFDALDFQTTIGADVRRFDASGHADREDLVEMARQLGPTDIILSHGDMDARAWFLQALPPVLPGARILNPEPQETYAV
ncbi:MAG: MBL fold metallo-hydrolase [Puniceicoccales bacterium]|jgi:Cft2 family RNA processing exonuclease|nr:MBL fold metallo-hydrolase [Puniceicoccales bacterium]